MVLFRYFLKLIASGTAIARASRAPSFATLASEEQEQSATRRGSGASNSSPRSGSPGRVSRTSAPELPGSFLASSPVSTRDHRTRLGSFDGDGPIPASSQRALFRAFSLATHNGNSKRVDGFPYLSFPTGQVRPKNVTCLTKGI